MRNKAFTLIELLVVITVISILAALLLPALSKAKDKGRSIACVNNLHGLGIALNSYAGDYDNNIPQPYWRIGANNISTIHWPTNLITNYTMTSTGLGKLIENGDLSTNLNSRMVFICPSESASSVAYQTFAANNFVSQWNKRFTQAIELSTSYLYQGICVPAIYDGLASFKIFQLSGHPAIGDWESISTSIVSYKKHAAGYNYIYYDGHAETYLDPKHVTIPRIEALSANVDVRWGLMGQVYGGKKDYR